MNWKVILSLLVVFVSGAAIGGAFTAYGIREGIREVREHRPERMGKRFAHHLERKLELTPEQSEQVKTIMGRTKSELEGLREEMLPKSREIMKRGGDEIASLLTPEQNRKFEKLRKRMQARAERKGGYHGRFHGRHYGKDHGRDHRKDGWKRGKRSENREFQDRDNHRSRSGDDRSLPQSPVETDLPVETDISDAAHRTESE